MTFKLLSALILALAANELIHNAFEVWGARQKIHWLTSRLDERPHGDWPININTWLKTIAVHVVLLVTLVGAFMAVFASLSLSAPTMLTIAIIILLVSYAYTVLAFDRLHKDIGHLLRRYKRK